MALLFILPGKLSAQNETMGHDEIDYNFEKYRQTFEEELKGLEAPGADVNVSSSFVFSSVPEWMFQPVSGSPEPFLIGISDPGIDSTTARSQAVSRAIYLYSVMHKASVSNLVDYYLQDYQSQSSQIRGQYVDYFEFESQAPFNADGISIIKEEFTDFGECVVQIRLGTASPSGSGFSFKTVGMISEFEKNGIYECNSRIELTGESSGETSKYISRSVNGLIEAESYFNGQSLPVISSKLKYKQPKTLADSNRLQGAKTDRGLWNAYLTALIKAVTIELRTIPAEFRSASDNYSDKTQTLSREASSGSMTFIINQIFLNNNKIWANIDQFNFTQP